MSMNFISLTLITTCLLTTFFLTAQEGSGGRTILIAELNDTIDQRKADLYLNKIEEEIGKLSKKYPQLASWNLIRERKRASAGKERTSNALIYAHGLKDSKSSNYLDRYGNEGFYLYVRIDSQRQFSRLSGPAIDSIVFGWSVADGCVVASLMSANPKVPKLEKKIMAIVKRGLLPKPCY